MGWRSLLLALGCWTCAAQALHGRFLHITDIHPDPFYVPGTPIDGQCHIDNDETKLSSDGAGAYGAPNSECDSPFALVNATFDWLEHNLRDQIDFVIWTGDNARHDYDLRYPRSRSQLYDLNSQIALRFERLFPSDSPLRPLSIPVIPSIGNNDIFPHNVFEEGPNLNTHMFLQLWSKFIPQEQRHLFTRGAYYYVEVIPNRLAVIALNTLYFFTKNGAASGCDDADEPGTVQFEWLKAQMEIFRKRGVKVLLTGHVPPAWQSYEESCWHKYVVWAHAFRDIIVGQMYGHANFDHFIPLDMEDADPHGRYRHKKGREDEARVWGDGEQLLSMRDCYSDIPLLDAQQDVDTRYSIANVAASIVPNYFPGLRVVEYNISGMEDLSVQQRVTPSDQKIMAASLEGIDATKMKKKKKKKKKKDKHRAYPTFPKNGKLGPAYRMQPLSLLRYIQYHANLTEINESGNFSYQVEYATDDKGYSMPDLTVGSYLHLANQLAKPGSHENGDVAQEEMWALYKKRAFVGSGIERTL